MHIIALFSGNMLFINVSNLPHRPPPQPHAQSSFQKLSLVSFIIYFIFCFFYFLLVSSVQSPLQLAFAFEKLARQLRCVMLGLNILTLFYNCIKEAVLNFFGVYFCSCLSYIQYIHVTAMVSHL